MNSVQSEAIISEFQKQRADFLTHIESLKPIFERCNQSFETLDDLCQKALVFKVKTPLVGAFSSGKTTWLNTELKDKIFSVEVNPETAMPVEVSYGDTETFIGKKEGAPSVSFTKQQIKEKEHESLAPSGWLECQYPAQFLKHLTELVLVDMPGWDSGIDRHGQAIDQYLEQSLAYCLFISVDEGNLRQSLSRFLQELARYNMPAIIVLSKSDKKPQQDIDDIQAQIVSEVKKVLGQEPIAVVQVSSRKKKTESLVTALNKLHEQVCERFDSNIIQPAVRELHRLDGQLDILLNTDNLNEEELINKKKELERQRETLQQQIIEESESLERKLDPALNNIMRHVQNRLMQDLNSLAQQALYGGDLQSSIGYTVRIAISEGIEQEIAPKLKEYFKRVEQAAPDSFNIKELPSLEGSKDTFDIDLGSIIAPLLTFVVNKLLKGLGPIGSVISTIVAGIFSNTKEEEVNDSQRLERVKSHVCSNIIPSVCQQLRPALSDSLSNQVADAQQKISASYDNQLVIMQKTLDQLSDDLKKEKESFEILKKAYTEDQTIVKNIVDMYSL